MRITPLSLGFAALVLSCLAVATPLPRTLPASQCTTGPVQCCNNIQDLSGGDLANLFGLVNVVAQGVTVAAGITCSPISVIGVGGDSCSAEPVCCENNTFHGLVSLGCVPVDLSL